MRFIEVVISSSFALAMLLFSGCSKLVPDNGRAVAAAVGNDVLYMDEVSAAVPAGTAAEDSARMVQDYVRRWATDAIMYDKARRNVKNSDEIDDMVERYRRSLTIYRYQQDYVAERMPDITDDEVLEFYRADTSRFVLKEDIVRGVMIAVPLGVSGLDELARRMRRLDGDDLEFIEKFSYKNAVSYDYFADTWVAYRTLRRKMPLPEKLSDIVAHGAMYEVRDSSSVYLIHVSGYRMSGSPAPFEYISSKVREVLYNKRKKDFIIEFERTLYNNAVESGKVTFGQKSGN